MKSFFCFLFDDDDKNMIQIDNSGLDNNNDDDWLNGDDDVLNDNDRTNNDPDRQLRARRHLWPPAHFWRLPASAAEQVHDFDCYDLYDKDNDNGDSYDNDDGADDDNDDVQLHRGRKRFLANGN